VASLAIGGGVYGAVLFISGGLKRLRSA